MNDTLTFKVPNENAIWIGVLGVVIAFAAGLFLAFGAGTVAGGLLCVLVLSLLSFVLPLQFPKTEVIHFEKDFFSSKKYGKVAYQDIQAVFLYKREENRSPVVVDLKDGRKLKWVQSGDKALNGDESGYHNLYAFYKRLLLLKDAPAPTPREIIQNDLSKPILPASGGEETAVFSFPVSDKKKGKFFAWGILVFIILETGLVILTDGAVAAIILPCIAAFFAGMYLLFNLSTTEEVRLGSSFLISKLYGRITFDSIQSARAVSEKATMYKGGPITVYYIKMVLKSGKIIVWKLKGGFSKDAAYHSFHRFREELPETFQQYQNKTNNEYG